MLGSRLKRAQSSSKSYACLDVQRFLSLLGHAGALDLAPKRHQRLGRFSFIRYVSAFNLQSASNVPER